ncbi:MAG: T9SS type A sorting domain-containing protein [Chitinophagales bacterium]|nr:T9SS type A sorting domain-containing protein [Chitinophagales bacterium]
MKSNRQLFWGLCLLIICGCCLPAFGNDPAYEQRRTDYTNTALANFGGDAITLQAYQGVPLDSAVLNDMLAGIAAGTTSDFTIVKLIRILFFTNGTYDAQILPVLNSVPYWINKDDTVRNYWSENHMIMWMSSDWLLHEKYGRTIDNTLDARLRHYLELKVQYGFYEFFSSTYAPFSLSGLLNLADFAQDVQIKNLATLAAQRLLKDMLLLTNDKGVFFPVAGRNYSGKYENPYGQNHNNLIYLLTGFGEAPDGASHAGGFLASSTLPVDSVIASWTAELDTVYQIGHTLDSGFVLNSGMSAVDKVVFQWSSGAYFHPDVVQQTTQLLVDSNMWRHVDFELLRPISFISPQNFPSFSTNLSVVSKSSVISGQDIHIFKNNSVTLASVLDFWKGKVGFQQHTSMANVGTIAVYTASGEVKANWDDRNSDNANSHLPYVQQKKNLALIMYRPEPVPVILSNRFSNKDVALHWRDSDFDEVAEDSLWLIGREENSYVAVRRSCIGEINNVRACETSGGQTWALMVGDSIMYGSFSNFKDIIHQSQFTEEWYYDSLAAQSVYYAKITVDTLSIEYAWGVDSVATGIRNATSGDSGFNIFPNPANDKITLNLSAFTNQAVTIKVLNSIGQEVYYEQLSNITADLKTINTTNWSAGIYMVLVENQQQRFVQKLSKVE